MNTTLPEREVFRPRYFLILMQTLIVVLLCIWVGSQVPATLIVLAPVLGVVLVLGYFMTPGLIISDEGIDWYVLRPGWRFRRVPWQAVVEVRRTWLGREVVIKAERRRYEPWVWGRERPDELCQIVITNWGLERRGELFRALQGRWSARQLNQANYDQIAEGITLKQVQEVLGPGEVVPDAPELEGVARVLEKHTDVTVYKWEWMPKTIWIIFVQDKVVFKSRVGF